MRHSLYNSCDRCDSLPGADPGHVGGVAAHAGSGQGLRQLQLGGGVDLVPRQGEVT